MKTNASQCKSQDIKSSEEVSNTDSTFRINNLQHEGVDKHVHTTYVEQVAELSNSDQLEYIASGSGASHIDNDVEEVISDVDLPQMIEEEDERLSSDENDSSSNRELYLHDNLDKLVDCSYNSDSVVKLLLFLATKRRHNISYACLEYIIKLNKALNNDEFEYGSKYHLQKVVSLFSCDIQVHHLCNECNSYVGFNPIDSQNKNTPIHASMCCPTCNKNINLKKNIDYGNFLYISLATQLKHLFESTDKQLYRNRRKKSSAHAFEDIFDGIMYKSAVPNENYISINCNIDGIPVFESSNYSMYPPTCTVNELHPKERRTHAILVSLWCGAGKPKNINEYLKPFVEETKILNSAGFTFEKNDQSVKIKVKVLVFICDAVARPIVANATQFNGKYGCNLCLHPGNRVPKGKGFVMVYPIDRCDDIYLNRNHADTIYHAQHLMKGFKSVPIVSEIPDFDVISGLVVDWMHAVPLGVCRQMAKLWFDSHYHEKPFYIGTLLSKVDTLLSSIKPSLDVSRTPRKMSDSIHWEAHEWAIFLLFYSIPILKECFTGVKKIYVKHFSLLVEGVYLLLKHSIMPSEIEYSKKCLIQFIIQTKELYGKEHVSFNIHSLLHLPENVINWGPLWTHSAFISEDCNQELLQYIQSSQAVPIQVCEAFCRRIAVNKIYSLVQNELTDNQQSFLALTLNKKRKPVPTDFVENIGLLGAPKVTLNLTSNYYLAFERRDLTIVEGSAVQFYERISANNVIFHSKMYKRPQKRSSYCVILRDDSIFGITEFLVAKVQGLPLRCYAIGCYYTESSRKLMSNTNLKHLIQLNALENDLSVVTIDQIKEKVTLFKLPKTSTSIACVHPNNVELMT